MANYLITDAAHPLAEEIAGYLRSKNNTVYINDKDITTREGIKELVSKAGYPDGVIISSYDNAREPIDGGDPEKIISAAKKNMLSTFNAARHFGALMVEKGTGSIILLSSIFADKPTGCNPAYSISQGSARMVMKELALFYGNNGVRVNMLKLAPCDAEKDTFDSEIVAAVYDIETKSPMRRRIKAADIDPLIELLLSPAGAGINGAEIALDGGLLYHYFDRPYKCKKESEL